MPGKQIVMSYLLETTARSARCFSSVLCMVRVAAMASRRVARHPRLRKMALCRIGTPSTRLSHRNSPHITQANGQIFVVHRAAVS